MKMNKWDYRYPFFGIQKLHNYRYGYGYGLPIFPKVNTDSNFLSIVNRLENEMKELQGMITEETLDNLRHLLEQFNGVDSVLNVDDVQAIVDYAIGSLEFPDVLTIDEVKQEITDAINTIDVGLTVMEVQILVGEMLDELELGLSQTQVETLIHESIALIDTGLNQLEVEFLIEKALMDIDKGLSEEEIIELIEFHSQTVPLDSIINDIENLRRDFEMIEIPDVDLTPIMVRIEELKNSMNDEYDDTHIINMINEIRNDIDNIDSEDIDLSEIYNYLNSLEEDVSRIEYDDSWIHTELTNIRNTIANIEIEGVDLTLIYDRLDNLELTVDNDTIYDDTEIRSDIEELKDTINNLEIPDMYDDTELRQEIERIDNKPDMDTIYDDTEVIQEIESVRLALDNIEFPDVDLSELENKLLELEETIDNVPFTIGNPSTGEVRHLVSLHEAMQNIYNTLNSSSTDPLPGLNEIRINRINRELDEIRMIIDDILDGEFGGDVDLTPVLSRLEQLEDTTYYWDGAAEDVENWLIEHNAQPLRFTGEGVYDPENLLLRADEKWGYVGSKAFDYHNNLPSSTVGFRVRALGSLIKGESQLYNYGWFIQHPHTNHHKHYFNSPLFILSKETLGEGDFNATFAINPKFGRFSSEYYSYDVIINIEDYEDLDGNIYNYKRVVNYQEINENNQQIQIYVPKNFSNLYIYPIHAGYDAQYSQILPNGRQQHELNAYGLWITERNVSEQ